MVFLYNKHKKVLKTDQLKLTALFRGYTVVGILSY